MYSKLQSLVAKAEQGMSDHSDFEHCKTVFNEWFDIAHGTLTDNLIATGSEQELRQRLETIKSVAARMTEGQKKEDEKKLSKEEEPLQPKGRPRPPAAFRWRVFPSSSIRSNFLPKYAFSVASQSPSPWATSTSLPF